MAITTVAGLRLFVLQDALEMAQEISGDERPGPGLFRKCVSLCSVGEQTDTDESATDEAWERVMDALLAKPKDEGSS